jgi:hypothetical protein
MVAVDLRPTILEVLILSAPRAYAVGRRFGVSDADGSDDFAWRPTDIYWTDVEYRRPRAAVRRDGNGNRRRRPAAVTTRVDPSRVRTRDQQQAIARAL